MVVGIFLLLFSNSYAQENCKTIKNYKEFYQCSLQKHPDFEISKLKMVEAKALEEQASQLQNPELEVQDIRGKSAGQNTGTTEAVLSIPISQFWVRGAKKDVGAADRKLAEIESSEALLDVRKKLIFNIYRLRQIESEIEIFDESIHAFGTIAKQLRSRPARGPEQEVTLGLVEIASSDYELKKIQLNTEKSEILSQLLALWGHDFKITKVMLPGPKDKWPEISPNINVSQSFQAQKVKALSEKALAEQSLANRESWPEVKLGPAIEQENDGVERKTSVGLNLSMSLPLLSLNQGSRHLASSRAKQAELSASYHLKKAVLEKEILIQKYTSAVAALKKHSDREEVRKKHHKVDSLFRQGLVAGGTVIEAHRQITEFTESQHKQELLAIESYLELKTLSGENVEEIL